MDLIKKKNDMIQGDLNRVFDYSDNFNFREERIFLDFKLRTVHANDMKKLNAFFEEAIKHTLIKDGIVCSQEEINEEINDKMIKAQESLKEGSLTDFFLAEIDGEMIATISINPPGDFSKKHMGSKAENIMEIASLYVKPAYQSKGIGKQLLNHAIRELKARCYKAFLLDSGYKEAQKVWQHLLGKPDIVLKDFWEAGADHMFWYKMV